MEKTIKVEGMHCNSCNLLIEDSVSEIKGVREVKADFNSGIVKVKFEGNDVLEKTKNAIEKEGYRVVG